MPKVDRFYLIDLDRTLVRTDDLRQSYEQIIIENVPDLAPEIEDARQRYKSNFDLVSYVRLELEERMNPGEAKRLLASFDQLFVEQAQKSSFFEPFAQELLQVLKQRGLSFGILTTGGDTWQQIKIEAAGLQHIPHLIIHKYEKGQLISSWRQPDGSYKLPVELGGTQADSLVFLDDKTVSFLDIPSDVIGVRIISVTAPEPNERNFDLPENVTTVHGLKEAYMHLFE